MPALLIRAAALVASLTAVAACDKAEPAKPAPAPAPTPAPPAPTIAAPTHAPTAPAPPAPAKGLTAGAPSGRCDAPVRHADEVRTTGTASLVAVLQPVEASIDACEREHWPDDVLACSATATTAQSLLYDCYARAFGNTPLQIKRRFNALEDNRAASPSPGSLDGDYIAVDDQCGSYTRWSPPAYAVYYVCGGEARGPFMTPDDIQALFAALSTDEANRHELVMSLIAKTTVSTHRVDVYDEHGTYQGTHTEF